MNGIALMATAMNAARHRLDISAANLANVSVDGFHKSLSHVRLTAAGLEAASAVDGAQGALKATGRPFDLAIAGPGGLLVRDGGGAVVETRGGSFRLDARGHLVDELGRVLLGRRGPIVADETATIDPQGGVRRNGGESARIALRSGATVQSGFLEGSNVDAVHEMVDVLGAQRAFETAEKTLGALDEARQKDVNDVVRVKS